MSQTRDEMVAYLEANGWREYANAFQEYSRCFYKRFPTYTPCACNADKPGLQVCVSCAQIKDPRNPGEMYASYEITAGGELHDGTWIEVHQWGLHMDIEEGLRVIPRMLSAWEHLHRV